VRGVIHNRSLDPKNS